MIPNEFYYLHTDRLGSGSAVTDGSGEAVHVLGYMPYGETLLDLSHTPYETPYQFTGYEKDQTFSFAISNWDGEGGLTIKRPDGVIEMQIPTGGTNIQPTDYVVYPEVAKYMFSMGVHEGKHGYDLWQKGAVRNEDDFFNREVSAYSRQYSYDQKSMPSSFCGNVKNINDIIINWVRGIYSGKGSGRNYLYKERSIRNEDYERRILPKLKNK